MLTERSQRELEKIKKLRMDQEKDLANKQIKLKAKEDLTASKLQGRLNQIRI